MCVLKMIQKEMGTAARAQQTVCIFLAFKKIQDSNKNVLYNEKIHHRQLSSATSVQYVSIQIKFSQLMIKCNKEDPWI